jgi:hypothetical protein
MADRSKLSHREYVIDRGRRIQRLFEELEGSDDLRSEFFKDPESVADRFAVGLKDEEALAIKAMGDAELAGLKERLAGGPLMIFDANCGCAMSELGLIGRPGE